MGTLPIDIVVSNGEPYIWKPADWYRLRVEYRIMGSFDGAISENEGNQVRLPFKLTTVEVQYLIKHGIGRTVVVPHSHVSIPVPAEAYETLKSERLSTQLNDYKLRKQAALETLVDKIIEGKLKKGIGIIPDREALIQDELNKVRRLPLEFVQIDSKDPWLADADYIPCEFPQAKSPLEKLLLLVFEDFHIHRKYFLTSGVKFGGHFLAYPGDPAKYHAEFIIVCKTLDTKLPDLISRAERRLAVGVRKTLLIASMNTMNGTVFYERGRLYET